MGVSHGTVLHIHELLARVRDAGGDGGETSVRVLGSLLRFDPSSCRATIVHDGSQLDVDTSTLGSQHPFREGDMLQFIGEVSLQPPALLRARVMRNVNGLNLDVFEHAVREKRRFEASLAPS